MGDVETLLWTDIPPPSEVRVDPPAALLLDRYLDASDAHVAAHVIVDAVPATTFAAARDLDFLTVHSPLMDSAMWVRGLPARLRRADAPEIASMVLGHGETIPGWSVLGERAGHEIVFGAIGVFWTPSISWHDPVAPEKFAGFVDPGWGKIACSFSVSPYGTHRSLLTYECRTLTTDAESRQRFLRYWRLIRPFVGHIMGATVQTIQEHAEQTP
jgi:hypothetical protein